ncbi:MAG: TlpA disulfide reductase family protein [Acidimicrobiia bacterium]
MFLGIILVGLAVAWVVGAGGAQTAIAGSPAPEFTVDLFDGSRFDLAERLSEDDRPLILNVWASWCPPCREEIPALSAFADAHPEYSVLGVAVEEPREDSIAFANELSPSYPLGWGDDEFRKSYQTFGLPVTYMIDADGKVTEVFNGGVTLDKLETLTAG